MTDWEIRGKPALLILHMQHGILDNFGNVPGSAEAIKKAGMISHQQMLLKAFRDKKLSVIYVTVLHVPTEQNPIRKLPAYGNIYKIMAAHKDNPHSMEVISELTPEVGEPVLVNWLLGAFTNSGLFQVLKTRDIETLILAGYATNMVVYNTSVQAADLCYSVIVAGDACASQQEKVHQAALDLMLPNIALVTTAEDVIAHL